MCCLRAAAGVLPPPLRFFLFWVGDDVFVGNVAAAASCGADERRRAFQHRLLSPRCSGPRHVAGLVPMCVVRCMYACRRSCPSVCFPRVFPESVFRVCFPRVFSFFLLLLLLGGVAFNCLSMAFASRWPLPLDGFSMAFRWPLDGLSMAYRWGVSPHLPLPRPLWRREAGVGRRISRARARGAVAARRARVAHRNCPGLYLHPHSEALDPKP